MQPPTDGLTPRQAFRFCPGCGAPAAPAGGPLDCPGCGLHLYFNPAVAVAAFARRGDGRWLFIRRGKDPGRGRLAPPGGFIDFDETAEAAVHREFAEEVGVALTNLRFVASRPNRYAYRGLVYPVLDLFFAAEVASGGSGALSDEVSGVEWLTLGEVAAEDLAFTSMQSAWLECRRLFAEPSAPR